MTDYSEAEFKPLWDALNKCRIGVLGRLNHPEIVSFLVDLEAEGYTIVKKPEAE